MRRLWVDQSGWINRPDPEEAEIQTATSEAQVCMSTLCIARLNGSATRNLQKTQFIDCSSRSCEGGIRFMSLYSMFMCSSFWLTRSSVSNYCARFIKTIYYLA